MDQSQLEGLDFALNEANLLGVEVCVEDRVVAVTLEVLTLPESGPPPADRRLSILLYAVGRVAASFRNGRWDDRSAHILPLKIGDLLTTIRNLGCRPIYGWEFFDLSEPDFLERGDRLSFDHSLGHDGRSHRITLFQEGASTHLDLCI